MVNPISIVRTVNMYIFETEPNILSVCRQEDTHLQHNFLLEDEDVHIGSINIVH